MRNFMDIIAKQTQRLNEAEGDGRETKTKTKSDKKFDLMPDLESGSKSVAKTSKAKSGSEKSKTSASSYKQAGGAKTRRSAASAGAGMTHHAGAGEAMRSMMNHGMEDEISDDQARRNAGHDEPDMLGYDDTTARLGNDRAPGNDLALNNDTPTNDNLPALVNKEIALADDSRVVPEWHQVKHLPGYMLNAIRAGGRQVFKQFTDTPIEDIQMICTLPGMNSEQEVKTVMNWVRQNGTEVDKAKMTFGGGVEADVRFWKANDFAFLIVSDFMGKYVYSWVSNDSKNRLSNDKRKQISQG